jgi:hypothetical protein
MGGVEVQVRANDVVTADEQRPVNIEGAGSVRSKY